MNRVKLNGVSRMFDNDKVVLVLLDKKLTDKQLKFFHEVCRPLIEMVSLCD